jgi:hypothetical protein
MKLSRSVVSWVTNLQPTSSLVESKLISTERGATFQVTFVNSGLFLSPCYVPSVEDSRFRQTSVFRFIHACFHHVKSLSILYATVPNPGMDVDRPKIEKERVWRAPPTLDAKHLWFTNLEDYVFSCDLYYIMSN